MKNKFTILVLSILTFGCGGDIIVKPVEEEPIVIHPAPPSEMSLRNVEWKVLTEEKLKELMQSEDDLVFFALTTKDYENLSLNMQEIIRYIREQKDIIIYYRELFPTPSENKTEE